MKILSLETSGETADLSILDTELDRIWEKPLPTLKGVSEVLTTEIEDLLEKAMIELEEIELIAVGTGPGSYTGTRVGIATAKGLAQGLNIPIVGINSFEALIEVIDEDYADTDFKIIPLIDARNNRVYYQFDNEQGCKDIVEIIHELSQEDKNYVFVGTGTTANKDALLEAFQGQAKTDERDQILSRFIAQIADGRAQNNLFDDIIALKPLYINTTKIG